MLFGFTEPPVEHIKNDPVVNPVDVRNGEIIMNNHVRHWVRICNIGENQGHKWRVNRALIYTFKTEVHSLSDAPLANLAMFFGFRLPKTRSALQKVVRSS